MDFETLLRKPRRHRGDQARVAYALERHPLCRTVQFDIISKPRTGKAATDHQPASITPDALWEASDIVADIQDASILQRS